MGRILYGAAGFFGFFSTEAFLGLGSEGLRVLAMTIVLSPHLSAPSRIRRLIHVPKMSLALLTSTLQPRLEVLEAGLNDVSQQIFPLHASSTKHDAQYFDALRKLFGNIKLAGFTPSCWHTRSLGVRIWGAISAAVVRRSDSEPE